MSLVISDPALDLALPFIAHWEGFRAEPYQDQTGVWTIGYGCTVLPSGVRVTATTPPCTEPQARGWLEAHVAVVLEKVRAYVHVPLEPHEEAALASFAYNLGTGALASSTLLRELNAGDRAGAASQFGAWVYVAGRINHGLVDRRAAERAMFEGRA